MPKSKYDYLIDENLRLKKEIEKIKYRTYINFRTDDKKCRSIDFPGLYSTCNSSEELPSIIKELNDKITKTIKNVNWVINDKNEKATKCKAEFIEIQNFNKKKSFWDWIWN